MLNLKTILFLTILLALSCTTKEEAPPAPQKPQVNVAIAQKASVPVVAEIPGRLEASRQAEVRARAAGIVMERLYQEGQEVKKGTPLFRIDPAPLKAALAMTEGQVASAEAQYAAAADKFRRYKELREDQAVSELEYTTAKAEEAQARAAILSAKAARVNAKLNLDYANVTSPIAGRARRAQVTEGALVGLDSPTPLTIVEQIDPIYVNFSQPSSELFKLRKKLENGKLQSIPQADVPVQIVLVDGSIYPETGKLLFSDVAVDPSTDTVSMRALFSNPRGELLPGAYVRVKIPNAVNNATVLIPRDSLVRGVDSATVMVVNNEGKIEPVAVKADQLSGENWVVSEGLSGGERVVLTNPGRMRPGTEVVAVEKAAGNLATGASKGGPSATRRE